MEEELPLSPSGSRPRTSVVFHDPGELLQQLGRRRKGASEDSADKPPRTLHLEPTLEKGEATTPLTPSQVTFAASTGTGSARSSFRGQANSWPGTPASIGMGSTSPASITAAGSGGGSEEKEQAKVKETIRVVIRVRPLHRREAPKQLNDAEVVRVDFSGTQVSVGSLKSPRQPKEPPVAQSRSAPKAPRPEKSFAFDRIFDSRSSCRRPATQEQVYQEVGERLVQGAVAGYNGCLFAYGQTGAGKTHSVVGPPEDPGLLPRVVEGLFAEATHKSAEGASWFLKASLMELYNETLRDLLVPPRGRGPNGLSIRYNPALGLVINDLKEVVVATLEDARELLDFGMKMRSIAATSMNSHSSRAHTIFTFRLEQSGEGGQTTMAQVQIVDLAGREQEKTSGDHRERLRERSFINRSLFHLSLCIGNLSKGSSAAKGTEHAYRNSKLTMVLMNSLGKNSRTALLAAISPAERDLEETISTLRFAATVKLIQTQASKNMLNKRDLVDGLQEEIQRLRSEQNGELEVIQDRVAELEALCQQYRSDLEFEKEQSRDMAMQRKKTLKRLGLSFTEHEEPDEETPYLVNLSEDPFLEGCLMYLLKRGECTKLGSSPDCTIQLVGLGVSEHHCTIVNKDDEEVSLEVDVDEAISEDRFPVSLASRPRTLVNGHRVSGSGAVPLSHQDRLILGHSYIFRVVVPATARNLTSTRDLVIGSDGGTDDDGYLRALEEIEDYDGRSVSRCLQRFSNEQLNCRDVDGKTWSQEVHLLAAQIEEANSITASLLPDEVWEFQLLLGDPLLMNKPVQQASELVVAVLYGSSSGEDSEGVSSTPRRPMPLQLEGTPRTPDSSAPTPRVSSARLPTKAAHAPSFRYIWPLDKFRSRLQTMRDLYEDKEAMGLDRVRQRLQQEPFMDPWKEIASTDVELLLQGISAAHASLDGGFQHGLRTGLPRSISEDAIDEDDSTFGESETQESAEPYPWYNLGLRYVQKARRSSFVSSDRQSQEDLEEDDIDRAVRRQPPAEEQSHRPPAAAAEKKVTRSRLRKDGKLARASSLTLQPDEQLVEPQEEATTSCELWKLGSSHVQEKTCREHYRLREVWVGKTSGAIFYRSGTGDEKFFFDRVPLKLLELKELPVGTTCFKYSFAICFPKAHPSQRAQEIEPTYFGVEDEDTYLQVLHEYARQRNAPEKRLKMIVTSSSSLPDLPPSLRNTEMWRQREASMRRWSQSLAAKRALLQEAQQDLAKLKALCSNHAC